ncbi:MAG: ABC transporter ATP-binding protein [Patescibacteria group bacterium]|nr:ABC transporter ATP-binding protein [Patescibacteria group bacterium]
MQQKLNVTGVLRAYWPYIKANKGWMFLGYAGASLGVVANMIDPWLYKLLLDEITSNIQNPAKANLVWIILLVLISNLIGWAAYRAGGFVSSYVQPVIMSAMTRTNLERLLGQSYQFFTNNFAGSLQRKIQRFSGSFENVMDVTEWDLFPMIITVVIAIGTLSFRSKPLAIIMFVWVVTIVAANYFFHKWKLKYDLEKAEEDTETSGALADVVSNSVNVKLFSGYEFERKKFFDITEKLRKITTRTWTLAEWNFAFQSLMGCFLEFGIMYFVVKLWQRGAITVGDVILVQGYLIALIGRLWNVGRIMRKLYESFADAQEMVDVLNRPYDVKDLRGAKKLNITRGKIEFKEVSFNYSQTREVLKDMNLTVRAGERVALVGPSGAGKSTIVKLILRFYDLDGGKILIDGQDIKRVTQNSLREQIAMVPQDPFLFHRSIRDNIRYGRRDASDEDVEKAAALAHCAEFIERLPQGYDTFVGERGIKLSGGERQRVAIARAILSKAPILVLDEATSSLDSESEALIQDALKTLMKGKTVMVIAHRLSTIMQMDRIVVIDDGKVTDQGTHEVLLSREGLYQKLWNIQAGGFIS